MSTYDMPDQSPVSGADEDEVMRDLLRMITEQIWWVIGITAVVILAASVYANIAPRIYSADALLQVESPSTGGAAGSTIASLSTSGGGGAMHTDAEIEIIKSRAVVEPVVQQFKLNFGAWPNTMPYVGRISSLFARAGHPMPAWFGMRTYAWGGEVFSVESFTVPKNLEGVELTLRAMGAGRYELLDPQQQVLLRGTAGIPAEENGISLLVGRLVARPDTLFFVKRANQLDAVNGLAGGLQVQEKGHDTGIVQLSYMGVDPKLITAITNAVAASYMRQRTERAQEEASKMLSFLNSELPRLRAELKRTETALSEYQTRVGSFQPTQEASVFLAGGLDYERQIAGLRIARAQVMQRFTPDSPEVQSIDAQLAALSREKARFEDHFKTMPGSEREAVSLQRDAKVAEEIYVTLLNKTQELSITRAGTIGKVHIIDEALVPSAPIRPNGALIISAGAALGLIAGIGFAFCRRTFFAGVDDPDLVERRFQLPIFGAIAISTEQARNDRLLASAPRPALPDGSRKAAEPAAPSVITRLIRPRTSSPDTSARGGDTSRQTVMAAPYAPMRSLLAKTHPFDASVEGLRGLRATLQFGLVDVPNRVVAFTSPAPSDGKSFLCANLAALFAESGQRVLLIDADLRRGRLAHYFGRSPKGGLTELLTGQVDLEVAARTTGVDGLHFIAAGAYPPNPSEILASHRFAQILQRFSEQFDLVIVDTPPLLAVADAAIVANIAGATVLVMRAGAHTERNISASLKKLQRARAHVIGGVMNAVTIRRSGYGTYDYAYAYTYTAGDPGAHHS